MSKEYKNELFNVKAEIKDGEILFDLETVARSLGFVETKGNKEYVMWRRVNSHLSAHLPKGVARGDSIPEAAVYMLAFKASNETAQKFQLWLAKEVLPQIRNTGAYSMDRDEQITINANDLITMAKQLGNVVSSQAEIIKSLEVENKVLKERIHHVPVQGLETYTQMQLGIEGVPEDENLIYTVTEIAAEYNMNAKNLNSLLHEIKIQYPLNGMWILYADHRNKGYTKTIKKHMYWTELGKELIKQKLSEAGISNG